MAARKNLADKLLDAQVAYIIEELSGDRFAEVVARDVDDVLAVAATLKLNDVVDPDDVKATARRLVDSVGASPLLEDMVGALSDAIYDLDASEEYHLGDVIEREPVEALITKLLSMRQLQDRALERMAESPLVASVAAKFVTKLVSDFLAQNRARAERLPGVGSMLKVGMGAANMVKSPFDKQLDQLLGDAAGKGTQAALKRTNKTIKEMLREAPLKGAALEIWDLHADEPIADLREYLSQQDLRELALIVHDLVTSARTSEFAEHLLDACIDVFFDLYGEHDLARLIEEVGISRDDIVEDICRFAPPVIEAAKRDGVLDQQIRARLEPFFHSPAVAALLARSS
jgi:hypothetical protein